VGFLWNSSRVTLSQFADAWELNGAATETNPAACSSNLRIVLGDYNTMGREEPPPIAATAELAVFDQELAPGFRRLPMTPGCTEYFEGQPGALDHVVVSAGMQEAGTSARVTGYCAVAACAPLPGALPAAALRLSDHCPVLMDIRDEDRDD
jgi:predicted extracellular nuclease